jgi:hypothetical protein
MNDSPSPIKSQVLVSQPSPKPQGLNLSLSDIYKNNDISPSRSTSSTSSMSSDSYNRRRMVPKEIYNKYNEEFFFPAYENVQYKKPIIPNKPKSIEHDPIAIAIFEKIKENIENNNFEEIEFNPEELGKISNIKELADFSDEYHRYIIKLEEQKDLRSFGGKFKKSKRKYKSNKYKSRKGGKYRKTRKGGRGGFGSSLCRTFTKCGKGGKSKNKKTRKH